jgi:hypothetical protein
MKTDEAIAIIEFCTEATKKLNLYLPLEMEHALSHAIEHMKQYQWRPIEEAPRDGIRIYGYDKTIGKQGVIALNSANQWACVDAYNVMLDIIFYPTHYMPLPEFEGK